MISRAPKQSPRGLDLIPELDPIPIKMDDIELDRLLSGDLSRLPSLPKRVVRLFISSTFTDMTLERNTLMERVYPRLKRYCRERHGLDFQVVDMRWGVRDEATDDHQTVNLCRREIENCQRVSLGPNFVALIGDKYGFRPLLNRIKSTEYRSLRRCLIEADINTDFLDTWYKEDLNAVPAEYLLQPISSILKNFTNRDEPELQSIDQRIWMAVQERLHELLLIGSGRLVEQGRMSERDRSLKYSISVTEREVLEGCLNLEDTKLHCLVYVRLIEDLRDQLSKYLEDSAKLNESHRQLGVAGDGDNRSPGGPANKRHSGAGRKASLKIGDDSVSLTTSGAQSAAERRLERQRRLIGKYIDLASRDGGTVWQVDEEAQEALSHLREQKLKSKLSPAGRNLTIYRLHWNDQDGISVKSDEHKRYLNELTDHFYQNLVRMIRSAVKSERSKLQTSGPIGEVLQHSHHSLQVGKRVHGRSLELDLLRSYIANGPHESSGPAAGAVLPMFVYGTSGAGKTSVLARAATLAGDWIKQAAGRRVVGGAGHSMGVGEQADSRDGAERWDRWPCVIVRFCCTTPASSSMVAMLTSVCRQLQYNFYQFGPIDGLADQRAAAQSKGAPGELEQLPYQQIPEDFVRLVYTFRRLLDNCGHPLHRRRRFVFILDSIERLSAPAECTLEAKFSWLTSLARLPANVRLLVSCGSSGDTPAALDDFLYLKRHFLQLHLKMQRRTAPDLRHTKGDSDAAATSDCGSSSEGLDDLASSSRSGSPASSPASLDGELRPDERPASRFQFPRRLILPAARLARGSRGLTLDDGARRRVSFTGARPQHQPAPNASVSAARDELAEHSRAAAPGELRRVASEQRLQSKGEEPVDRTRVSSGLLHIRPLGPDVGQAVLRRWLAESGRSLSRQQWAIVARSLGRCSRPIFVKLALGEVVNWKSYSMQGDTRGLTFGSAWLADFGLDQCAHKQPAIAELARLAARGADEDQELRLKWQLLAMEQQWLNYLDYRSRSKGDDSQSSDGGEGQPSGRQESGDLVIRIGNLGSSSGVESSSGGRAGAAGRQESSFTATSSSPAASSAYVCHLSLSIGDAICQLFARIELKHGYLLTKHSLSYITAARNGICENELEDLLSLDDVVLDDVFQYHLPPVRRIPPLLWTRIRGDLPDYLSERDADGVAITWHHHQFNEVTARRYLAEDKQLVYVHSLMADYFLGKWASKPKPFRCTKQQVQMAAEQLESAIQQSMRHDRGPANELGGLAKRQSSATGTGRSVRSSGSAVAAGSRSGASFSVRHRLRSSDQHDQRLQWMQAKAHRRVPQQPLYYEIGPAASSAVTAERRDASAAGGPQPEAEVEAEVEAEAHDRAPAGRRYNLRKLTELPHHLLRSGRFLDLASEVFFNYSWLFASIDALGLQSVFADLQETRQSIAAELAARRARGTEAQEEHEDQLADGLRSQSADLARELAVPTRDNLTSAALLALDSQLRTLGSTLRLSANAIDSNPQMLGPQLVGRLLPIAIEQRARTTPQEAPRDPGAQPARAAGPDWSYLSQLLEQCDKLGCSDCALLPTHHCLQSADGLQLSSLEGHPFGVMAMQLASDQRHLLAVSSKFIMWNLTTGEIARDVDPKLDGATMRWLLLSGDNKVALACTSDSQILALEILTQQVARVDLRDALAPRPSAAGPTSEQDDQVAGLRLIDEWAARRFFVWTRSGALVVLRQLDRGADTQSISLDYTLRCREMLACPAGPVLDLRVQETGASSDLLLVTLATAANTMRLVVAEASRSPGGPPVWAAVSSTEFQLLALSRCLGQVVYVDSQGDIMLSRRRAAGWSRGKRLLGAGQSRPLEAHAKSPERLLAIVVEAAPSPVGAAGGRHEALDASRELRAQLAQFEAECDGQCDEIQPLHRAFPGERVASDELQVAPTANRGQIGFVTLHYPTRIEVVQLRRPDETGAPTSGYKQFRLPLPRQIRNVSLEPNRSQLSSAITENYDQEGGHLLVVAATSKLLVYSLEGEHLLRQIEAHAARITALLPVATPSAAHPQPAGPRTSSELGGPGAVATCSLDRTIKIWNLANLSKQERPIERLAARQLDSLRLNNHRPLAACLSRGQLSIWNWPSSRLLVAFESLEQLEGQRDAANEGPRNPFACCKFSTSGRYLALATANTSIALVSIEGPKVPSSPQVAPVGTPAAALKQQQQLASEQTRGGDLELGLNLVAKTEALKSVGAGSLVLKMSFLAQDSRVLVVAMHLKRRASGSRADSASDSTRTRATGAMSDPGEQPHVALSLSCLTVPDLRLCYSIECTVPSRQSGAKSQFQSGGGDESLARHSGQAADVATVRQAARMVALTGDEQFLVVAEVKGPVQQNQPVGQTRRLSAVAELAASLNVYSTRDGQLARSVELGRLQTLADQPELVLSPGRLATDSAGLSRAGSLLRVHRDTQAAPQRARVQPGMQSAAPIASGHISLGPRNFNRLKSLRNRERPSIVALLDDERGLSYLVDVSAKLLVARSDTWSGITSSDGRYGLTRMTAGSPGAGPPTRPDNNPLASSASLATVAGLKLLELRSCRVLKSLMSLEQLSSLAAGTTTRSRHRGGSNRLAPTGEPTTADLQGLDAAIAATLCGFTRSDDAYVYLCQPRTRQLVLVRVRDSKLLANYKLACPASSIKSSSDGKALVVAQADGSLLALAIVDPQSSETQTRLEQYESRRQLARVPAPSLLQQTSSA